jgi:hypothetical protein
MNVKKATWYAWAGGSLATFGIIEALAVANKTAGDTLSANWWKLRTHLPVRLLIFPPLAWVGYHLFIPWDKKTGGMDDAAVIVAGVALALAARYEDRNGR